MPVLVIGGGKVAKRKTTKLLRGGAQITAISPEFFPKFPEKATTIADTVTVENFEQYLLQYKPQIVILATNDHMLHPKLTELCQKHSILVNDSHNGYTQIAFANTTTVNNSMISYFSHGDMKATRILKRQVDAFINIIDDNKEDE